MQDQVHSRFMGLDQGPPSRAPRALYDKLGRKQQATSTRVGETAAFHASLNNKLVAYPQRHLLNLYPRNTRKPFNMILVRHFKAKTQGDGFDDGRVVWRAKVMKYDGIYDAG